MEKRLKTVPEAAKFLQVEPHRVYDLVAKDLLPHVRLGERQIRFSDEQLVRFAEGGGNQRVKDEGK